MKKSEARLGCGWGAGRLELYTGSPWARREGDPGIEP